MLQMLVLLMKGKQQQRAKMKMETKLRILQPKLMLLMRNKLQDI